MWEIFNEHDFSCLKTFGCHVHAFKDVLRWNKLKSYLMGTHDTRDKYVKILIRGRH